MVLASQPRWASKVARQASWQGSLRLSIKKRVEKTRCNLDGAVLRSFVSLLGNASLYDWAWVHRYDHNRKLLNSFCLSSRSLVPAEGVKWPVGWFLTRYSRKFIFLSQSLPSSQRLVECFRNFEAKMAWRWKFRNSTHRGPLARLKVAKTFWPSESDVAPELVLLLRSIRTSIMEVVRLQTQKSRYMQTWCNKPPVCRIAERMLKEIFLTPIPNDKNSGYTLVADADLRLILLEITSCDRYRRLDEEELILRRYRAQGQMSALATRMAKLYDDKSVESEIQRSCRQPSSSDLAQFQLRCKSQKDPGEVWFRVITGNSQYKYRSLAMWVSQQARIRLKRHGNNHLVLSGVDFVSRL